MMHSDDEVRMMTEKRTLTLEDLWLLKRVTDVRLAPDGTTLAYVVGSYDERRDKTRSSIWLATVADGRKRQFTSGEAEDTQPSWSPDGERLAFVSTRHEGKPQVFVIDAHGGEPRRVTSASDGAHSPVWSPDGTHLCYAAPVKSDRQAVPQEAAWFEAHPDVDTEAPRMRRQRTLVSRFDGRGYIDSRIHLFVTPVDERDAAPRQLTEGDYDNLSAAWSPDGALIAFTSNRTAQAEHTFASDVWVVDVHQGEQRCL